MALPRLLPSPSPSLSRLSPRAPDWYSNRVRDAPASPAAAFSEQVLEQVDALHHFAHHLTRRSTAAEDLVQDTFLRALAGAGSFRPGSNLKAWLFRILRNAHLDALRREKNSPVLEADAAEVNLTSDEQETLRGDIEIDRLRRLVADDIDAALGALSPESRSVVLLDLEGFTEAEIAEIMSSAPGTVKSRLSRARLFLRKKLSEYAR